MRTIKPPSYPQDSLRLRLRSSRSFQHRQVSADAPCQGIVKFHDTPSWKTMSGVMFRGLTV